MSQRVRAIKRHRFYRHLFAVTVFVVSIQALPLPLFRLHLVGTGLMVMLLLVELGQVIPRLSSKPQAFDPAAARSAKLYQLLGLFGLGCLLVWVFTPASAAYTGFPVLLLMTAFVFWSLQRLTKLLGREESVGGEVLAGAVAGYLLLGLSGGLLLTVLETVHPGSFQNLVHHSGQVMKQPLPLAAANELIWDLDFSRITYFAFVALTTTGFGDIVPVTPPAAMASVALSIAGSLYLALVMGLLISRFTVQTQQEDEQETRQGVDSLD
ncbi:MAG: two pore domain potassium channel family protein [Cyanobacteria bacterium K_DeepCast_35m_m2_023]|nr:two pore domain potassium channel family protein [Cyanobacteria bacterium K_DeepCast_35m_m2_023]